MAINSMSTSNVTDDKKVKESLLNSLKAELEEVRRKKERAVGPEAYNYYWQKEKQLEDMIQKISILPSI
ncbi:MAG: hypothetical protein ACUVQ0_06505 [Thermoproteota archaeon]